MQGAVLLQREEKGSSFVVISLVASLTAFGMAGRGALQGCLDGCTTLGVCTGGATVVIGIETGLAPDPTVALACETIVDSITAQVCREYCYGLHLNS